MGCIHPQPLASLACKCLVLPSLQVCVEKWNLFNASRLHLPRPSAVALEVQRLNALDFEKKIGKSILGKVWGCPLSALTPRLLHESLPLPAPASSPTGWPGSGEQGGVPLWHPGSQAHLPSVWQVHLAMVRYHEGGRFCEKDEEWDRESAVFHLEHAANLGELEAIVGLGLMYSQLPHHILADVSLEVRGAGTQSTLPPPFPGFMPQKFPKHQFGARQFQVS